MARSRLELHQILCDILESEYCYYSPPRNIQLHYPCIVYNFSSYDTRNADNVKYRIMKQYDGTIITEDPDSDLPEKLLLLPYCSLNRQSFVTDGLYHYPFTLYF